MKHRKVLDATAAWAAQKWADQAAEALDRIQEANGGTLPEMSEADQVDHEAFVLLVQALVALEPVTGEKVDQELIQKAGLLHPAGR